MNEGTLPRETGAERRRHCLDDLLHRLSRALRGKALGIRQHEQSYVCLRPRVYECMIPKTCFRASKNLPQSAELVYWG